MEFEFSENSSFKNDLLAKDTIFLKKSFKPCQMIWKLLDNSSSFSSRSFISYKTHQINLKKDFLKDEKENKEKIGCILKKSFELNDSILLNEFNLNKNSNDEKKEDDSFLNIKNNLYDDSIIIIEETSKKDSTEMNHKNKETHLSIYSFVDQIKKGKNKCCKRITHEEFKLLNNTNNKNDTKNKNNLFVIENKEKFSILSNESNTLNKKMKENSINKIEGTNCFSTECNDVDSISNYTNKSNIINNDYYLNNFFDVEKKSINNKSFNLYENKDSNFSKFNHFINNFQRNNNFLANEDKLVSNKLINFYKECLDNCNLKKAEPKIEDYSQFRQKTMICETYKKKIIPYMMNTNNLHFQNNFFNDQENNNLMLNKMNNLNFLNSSNINFQSFEQINPLNPMLLQHQMNYPLNYVQGISQQSQPNFIQIANQNNLNQPKIKKYYELINSNNMVDLFMDKDYNILLQEVIEFFKQECNFLIFNKIIDKINLLATNRYSNYIIQKLLAYLSKDNQKAVYEKVSFLI